MVIGGVILEERKAERQQKHSLALDNREKINLSGVESVDSFNSEVIVMITSLGVLTIKGQDLDVKKLNLDDGNVTITGRIYSLVYSDRESLSAKSSGLLGKMFK